MKKYTTTYFTILEILAAVFIMAIGLISILAVFPASLELGARISNTTMAVMGVKQAMVIVATTSTTSGDLGDSGLRWTYWDEAEEDIDLSDDTPGYSNLKIGTIRISDTGDNNKALGTYKVFIAK